MSGSSPRVRGTLLGVPGLRADGRFIPACAGNSYAGAFKVKPSSGSSPRVRGTLPLLHGEADRDRFIPACAGNSFSADGEPGEIAGSSPRVRGTPLHVRVRLAARRFIPACAGNSGTDRRRGGPPPVHPRVCGELTSISAASSRAAGSSPRVRGTRQTSTPPATTQTVHPRVCGELTCCILLIIHVFWKKRDCTSKECGISC